MAGSTSIEWTDATWNPATGCTRVSPGCRPSDHCYAINQARRFDGQDRGYDGTTIRRGGRTDWTGHINLHYDRLDQPLHWRKPRRVFVCSMGDLFHPRVPDNFIAEAWSVMASAPRHSFQVLTKRPKRAARLLARSWWIRLVNHHRRHRDGQRTARWPLPNIWLGTSVEDQQRADERIPHLLSAPAAIRFVSAEPLLGPIDLRLEDCWLERDHYLARERLHWVIAGGESGPGARPAHPQWVRDLRDQCQSAGVAFLFKQWGAWAPDGQDAGGGFGASHTFADGQVVHRFGKGRAGRRLDGRTWDEFPGVRPLAEEPADG